LAGLAISEIDGGGRMKRIILTIIAIVTLCSCKPSDFIYTQTYTFTIASYPSAPYNVIIDGYKYSSGDGSPIISLVSGEEHIIVIDNHAPVTINNQHCIAIFWIHPLDWVLTTREGIYLDSGVW
jgi:hypothetical protein